MKFLQYLNLDQKTTLRTLGIVFLSYFILIFSCRFQNPTILYLRFFLALLCAILIPGYFLSVIVLDSDRLGKLAKIGVFYLSLIWGSIIVIFEVITISLVTTLSFNYLIITSGFFSLFLILLVFHNGASIKLEVLPSSEGGGARKNTPQSNHFLKNILIISVMSVLIFKARFLLYAIFNTAYLGGVNGDPAFHINYALEIVRKKNALDAFHEHPFGLDYPFGFHSLIAVLSILSGLPVLDSMRIMFFLFYSLSPIGVYLIIRNVLSERLAVYSLLFWAFHQSVEIGWIFLNSGLFARVLAYQFIFLVLLLITINGKYLWMLIALAAAFLTHPVSLIFSSAIIFFLSIQLIVRILRKNLPFSAFKREFSIFTSKNERIMTRFKVIIELSVFVLSVTFIVLSLGLFYSDYVDFIISKLNSTSSFQDWPRILTTQTTPNFFANFLTSITKFTIYALSGIIPIFILALIGLYDLFQNQRLKKILGSFDGLLLCWLILLTVLGLSLSQNPFVERIWGEVAVPLSFFAMRSFPRIEHGLANRIKAGQYAAKVFFYGFFPVLVLLTFHPGFSPVILTEIPSSSSELFSVFRILGLSYLKYLIGFSALTYAFYKLLKARPHRITPDQSHSVTLIFILILLGSTLTINIEFIPPNEVRFKQSDLRAAEWLSLNSPQPKTIVYAHALHLTTLWLPYYLRDYEIKTFVSIFNAGDFEQWKNGLPYLWVDISSKNFVSTSFDYFSGERSLNLTSDDSKLVAVSHEFLIRSRRQDFFRNDLDNITMSIWAKLIIESNTSVPFVRIESAVEGINESVSLFLMTKGFECELSKDGVHSRNIQVIKGSWTHISLNVSRYWSENYHAVLPARMRVILGINNYGTSGTPTNVLFDNFSFNSGVANIEYPLYSLLLDGKWNTDTAQYIFLGSNSTINPSYGYISNVSREFFSEPMFKRVFQDGTSEIYLYVGNSQEYTLRGSYNIMITTIERNEPIHHAKRITVRYKSRK